MKKSILVLSLTTLALLATLLGGCASARREQRALAGQRSIALDTPQAAPAAISKGAISITSVTDNRVFQNKPTEPFMPSVNGDVATMTPAQKSSMIGRQRNAYGKAVGDIALANNDTVERQARALVETALKNSGWQITPAASAPATAAVSINEFWAWFTPGAFTASFEARVTCTITMAKAGSPPVAITIQGYGRNQGGTFSDANWKVAYDRAYENFLENARAKLDATPF